MFARNIFLVIAMACAALAQDKPQYLSDAEDRMFRGVNEEREKRNLPALKRHPRLDEAAQAHAARVYDTGILVHQFKGEPSVRLRIAATGLRFNFSGENLAYSSDRDDLLPNLMQSPGHRANILEPKFNSIGIAIFKRGNRYYAVQNFARVTSEAPVSQAEQQFIDAFNALRKRRGMAEVSFSIEGEIRRAACGMADADDLNARGLPMDQRMRRSTAFTTFEPAELSDSVERLAGDPLLKQAKVGACHKATRTYASGVYWFGLVY